MPRRPVGDPNQGCEAALTQALQAANGNGDYVLQATLWNVAQLFSL